MRTSNPTIHLEMFKRNRYVRIDDVMTVSSTINKIAFLLVLTFLSASVNWYLAAHFPQVAPVLLLIGAIVGIIAGFVTVFKPMLASKTAPIYAISQGLFLGGISYFFESAYGGIVSQAVFLTFAVMAVLLFSYKMQWIQVTEKFRAGVIAATGALALVYMVSWIISLFGLRLPIIYGNGFYAIVINVIAVGIAALNLVLDFDFIQEGERNGADKKLEWYASFSLMVTLIWLYLEILKLLSRLRSRN